jgi:N-methylhydantoinase A/oxoprolinase/acetone carboxylase beta subunit
MLRIGVEIGGTFTDFAIWRNEGNGYVLIGSRKAPTSPLVLRGRVRAMQERGGLMPAAVPALLRRRIAEGASRCRRLRRCG